MTSLGRAAVRSAAWRSGGRLSLRFGQVWIGVIAARLLSPREFGLFAVALLVSTMLATLSESGIGASLIRDEDLARTAPTAVTLSLGSFTLFAAIFWAVSPGISELLGAPGATGAMRVMALLVLLGGPASVPAALLRRNFRQDLEVGIETVSMVVTCGVLVLLALDGAGALALAWSRVAGAVVVVIMRLAMTQRFRPGFDYAVAKDILRFGLPLSATSMLGSFVDTLDSIGVSKLLGPGQLGVYTLASNVASWPVGFYTPIADVMGFPLIARIRTDRRLVRVLALRLFQLIWVFFLPLSVALAALAPWIVDSLYGPKWTAAAPLLTLLVFVGFLKMFVNVYRAVLVAEGRSSLILVMQIAWVASLVPATWGGITLFGTRGAAFAQVSVLVVIVLPMLAVTSGAHLDLPMRTVLLQTKLPLLASLVAGVSCRLVADRLPGSWTPLLIGGITGGLVYAAITWRWGVRWFAECRTLLRDISEHADRISQPPAGEEEGSPLP